MSRFYAGIDLSARTSWICVLDESGKKLLNRKVRNDRQQIYKLLERFQPGLSAVVETTFNWYWLVDLLEDMGAEVKLAHALYVKAIAYAKVKTDQVDAYTLARLLRAGYIPEAFIYPRAARPTRGLLRRRHRLVRLRASLYRELKLQLMAQNITDISRNAIKKLDGRNLRRLLPDVQERQAGLALVHMVDAFDKEIEILEQEIHARMRRQKPIVLLKTIPGIGRILAPMIYYEIGRIDRFSSDKTFASYCRLAPTISQSGGVTRKGRNSKQGNRYLKWAFSEAAQMAIQRHDAVREYYERLLEKKKKRILAKSIVAHKLAVAAFHVLSRQEPYRPQLLTG